MFFNGDNNNNNNYYNNDDDGDYDDNSISDYLLFFSHSISFRVSNHCTAEVFSILQKDELLVPCRITPANKFNIDESKKKEANLTESLKMLSVFRSFPTTDFRVKEIYC